MTNPSESPEIGEDVRSYLDDEAELDEFPDPFATPPPDPRLSK